MSSLRRARIVVVGAGVLGLATAAVLARRGADVLVADPNGGIDSASAAAAGMISPAMEAALEDASAQRADIYRQAAGYWPEFSRDHDLGLIVDGADWRGPGQALAERLSALEFPFERHADHLHLQGEGRIGVRRALLALKAGLGDGAFLRARVSRIDPGPVVVAGDECIAADAVVLAAGWSAGAITVAECPRIASCVTPTKGQIIALSGAGTAAIRRIVRGPEVYLLPGPDGVIVGATMEPGRSDTAVDPAVVSRLQDAAAELEPGLRSTRVARAWAGVRGETPDGLPLLGATGAKGVYVALAPRRNGWLLAPLAAGVVAAAIAGDAPGAYAQAFRPDRFGPA